VTITLALNKRIRPEEKKTNSFTKESRASFLFPPVKKK
jgi:hypothetical protein